MVTHLQEGRVSYEVPHTSVVKPCYHCLGHKFIRCYRCSGRGKVMIDVHDELHTSANIPHTAAMCNMQWQPHDPKEGGRRPASSSAMHSLLWVGENQFD